MEPKSWISLRSYLGLNRNVSVLAFSIFCLGLGEEMWLTYLPKHLTTLGASSVVVGIFYSLRDLLDGLYQYPGGFVADRYGRKKALMIFTVIAMGGYALYALAGHWIVLFAGLWLVMAWKAGAFPATFAIIGDALPLHRRAIAFSVQSILVRFPRVIGAPLGGLLIASLGMIAGFQTAAAITILLASIVLLTQQRCYREQILPENIFETTPVTKILFSMSRKLKRLLIADCLVRFGEAIAGAFIILYVTNVLGHSVPSYGLLYALQQTISMLAYLPAGKLADLTGRRSMIAMTFLFFALFPVAVQWADSFFALTIAFVLGGLKELGEPARKALIVDLADSRRTARTVGIYYTIRNLIIVPAGLLGGILWMQSPQLPLIIAGIVAFTGLLVFLFTSKRIGS
jgi:MFS family permease